MSGHPEYKKILDEMWELHCRKAMSYGSDKDSLANLRNGERFGMSAWKRCLVESDSAFYRMQNYCNGRNESFESAENALKDAAAFSLLALLFLREERDKERFKAYDEEQSLYEDPETERYRQQIKHETARSGYRQPSEEIGNRMTEVLEKAK